MPDWLATLPIERDSVLIPVYIVAGVLLAVLLVPWVGVRGRIPVRLAWTALAAGIGALVGALLVWWTVDVQDVFGTPASDVVRAGVAGAGAGIGVAVAGLIRTRWWRKAIAVFAVVVFLITGGLIVNRDVAYFPRLGDVWGGTGVKSLPTTGPRPTARPGVWTPPADLPKTGTVGTVQIPGTVSRWKGRDAWVYLPPAARVKNPPALPVVVAFSGEPGGPSDVFQAGGLQAVLDRIAAQHQGIAPVVVVPDQLGSFRANPMCLNSPLGQVATYVTVDVRDWILHNLPVATDRMHWTAAGFSEGGTCAVQFAVTKPELFGSFIAVSPEIGPKNKSVENTIKVAFRGNRAAYEAALPITIMNKRKHYDQTRAVYAVGANDKRYGAAMDLLAAESRKVGMQVDAVRLPGLSHNWNTGAAGLQYGLDALTSYWKLP